MGTNCWNGKKLIKKMVWEIRNGLIKTDKDEAEKAKDGTGKSKDGTGKDLLVGKDGSAGMELIRKDKLEGKERKGRERKAV